MSLAIQTKPTLLGLRTQPHLLEIKQPAGKLTMKRQKVELVIEREPPQIQIDQRACFAAYGLQSTAAMLRESAQRARQIAYDEIGYLATEGDQLVHFENQEGDIFGELALQRMERLNDREWNITFIPEEGPRFAVTGSLKLNWRVSEGYIQYQPHYPQFNYQPGKLEIYVQQYGQIAMQLDLKV